MAGTPFPTQSLYGSFPAFPVDYVEVPNVIQLPSYIASMITYYTDVLNAPYSNPPSLSTWNIPYPNLLGIPTWLAELAAYGLGWGGAFVLWIVSNLSFVVTAIIEAAVNTLSGAFTDLTYGIEDISGQTGIFSPIVAAILMGMLFVVIIVGLFSFVNLIKGLLGGAE